MLKTKICKKWMDWIETLKTEETSSRVSRCSPGYRRWTESPVFIIIFTTFLSGKVYNFRLFVLKCMVNYIFYDWYSLQVNCIACDHLIIFNDVRVYNRMTRIHIFNYRMILLKLAFEMKCQMLYIHV